MAEKIDGLKELEALSKDCKTLRSVLHSRVVASLGVDADAPFGDDPSFLDHVVGQILLRDALTNTREKARIAAVEPPKIGQPRDYDEHVKVVAGLQRLMAVMEAQRESRMSKTERKPRIIRLVEKFQLTQAEARLFEAIAVKDVIGNCIGTYIGSDILSLSKNVDIPWKELFQFLDKNRPHIKQNLFEYFDADRPLQSSIQLMATVTAALFGHQLRDDDFLKIDGTSLAEVLTEEKGVKPEAAPEVPEPKPEEPKPEEPKEEKPLGASAEAKKFDDEPQDIGSFLKKLTSSTEGAPPPVPEEDAEGEEDESKLTSYRSDLDYLEAQIDYLFATVQLAEMKKEEDRNEVYGRYGGGSSENEQRMRQLQAKERVNRGKAQKRLELTKKASKWLPRVERMVAARNLESFEREVLLALIACHISPKFHAIGHRNGMEVGTLLRAFCKNFEEQVKYRKYFYKNATMVKEGILRLQGGSFDTDLNSFYCAVDRRMLDFAMGLDTEFSELVEGSHLYFPKVDLANVILADEQKKLIMDTVSNFEEFKRARRRFGFDEKVTYGSGMVMLFYGASGTGKTMLANAIGNHLNKRILLINFPSLGTFSGDENLKWIFREAKINDAILFFDECESIFESRDRGNSAVNLLLTEFERHDGLVILATNRAFDLDEAMHRRVTIAVEFQKPDPLLRERIWVANIPKSLRLAPDVDLKYLAMQFELTGGFIKNALLSALSMAVSREGEDDCVVRQEDLIQGCKLQLRGRLRMVDFHRRQVPTRGLDDLILGKEKKKVLEEIVMFEKARQVLFSQWGFEKTMGHDRGTTVLLYGPPGTGKTMSCEAIAFSMGKPLKVINSAELLSKWVGDTPKNIDAVFEEGKNFDAVLVFDEAEGLFGQRSSSSESSTDRYANVDVGLLLYHMERYPGVVVLSTNQVAAIDTAFFRRIKFVIEISLPEAPERARLWRSLIPKEAPLDKDVDFKKLGQLYDFSGGHIQSCIIRAAARAALHSDMTQRKLTMDLLMAAAKEEQEKTKHASAVKAMYT